MLTDSATVSPWGPSYSFHPCSICGARILDIDGGEQGPAYCPTHNVGRKCSWTSEGRIFQEGTRKKLVARQVDPIGLFAAVVSEYEEVEEPVFRVERFEQWYDPETGQKMGERVGSRPL